MRTLVFLLLLANLTLLGYIKLDSLGSGEAMRLSQQVQPDKIKLLTPQEVAALGPAKAASLANVCVEWGPFSDSDKTRALASLAPLDLDKLMSQKKVEVIAGYWVYLPPAANRAAADKRVGELRSIGIKDLSVIDNGPQRNAVSLGVFRGEDAARTRLAALQAQGLADARVEPKTQSVQQTMLVVRDPTAQAMTRIKELQGEFPGSDTKVGSCDRQT